MCLFFFFFPSFLFPILLSRCSSLVENDIFEKCLVGAMSGCDTVIGKLKVPVPTLFHVHGVPSCACKEDDMLEKLTGLQIPLC